MFLDKVGGTQRLIDGTVLHTTSGKWMAGELMRTSENYEAWIAGDKPKHLFSKAVIDSENSKTSRYLVLMEILHQQFRTHKRTVDPEFMPAAFTTHGQMGPKAIQLIEYICAAWTLKVAKQHEAAARPDGQRIEEITAAFRRDLKTELQVAIAQGWATQQNAAGLPAGACGKY